jgi:hypothetical protein
VLELEISDKEKKYNYIDTSTSHSRSDVLPGLGQDKQGCMASSRIKQEPTLDRFQGYKTFFFVNDALAK